MPTPNTIVNNIRKEYKDHGVLVAKFVKAVIVKEYPMLKDHVSVEYEVLTTEKYRVGIAQDTGFITVIFGLAAGHKDFLPAIENLKAQCKVLWNGRRKAILHTHAEEVIRLLQAGITGDSLYAIVNNIPEELV